MTRLPLKYDAACRAISEANTIDEVSDWIDKAAAIREYGRRIKNRKIELDAAEIRTKAKRRRGELILELKADGRLREGRKKLSSQDDSSSDRITLQELGISADESCEEQAIARIDGGSFDRLVARCRSYAEDHPEKHAINVLKPPPLRGPVNGAGAVAPSRIEPADSLDYFPTPPWATRALMRYIVPCIGLADPQIYSAWEPACGEGHIAEVLREYAQVVIATDIHPYGYGQAPLDFLGELPPNMTADWIITNPPFKDKTEPFVLRALDRAQVGVAMFVRMQWLETTGRYERIFRDRPPTVIAFFAERVPLCKGEWNPGGDTLTAYIWLVWVKGSAARAPIWIPPGCRTDLSLIDDVENFTATPVVRRNLRPR